MATPGSETRFTGAVTLKRLLVAAVLLAVAGCGAGGVEGTLDSIADLNPLRERERILPGERRSLIESEAIIERQITGGTATIGGSSAGSWTQPGGNAANNPGHLSFASPASRTFRTSLGGSGRAQLRISARPVASGGRVYIYKPDGSVVASSTGGGRVWQTSLRPDGERQDAQGGGLTTNGQVVLVGTGYGQFAALSASNGAELWVKDLPSPARSAPTVSGDTVFVVTQDSELFALSVSDGTEKWRNQGIPEIAGVLSATSPAVANGKVVVPYSSGEVIAFDADTGEVSWIDALATGNRIMAISGLSDISGSPVIANGVVYATGVSGRIIAVRLSNGERLWEENIGSPYTPIISGNALFMVDINDGMTALDVSSGEVLWRIQLPRGEVSRNPNRWAGPVLAGGALYAVSNRGDLIQVIPSSGAIASTTKIGDDGALPPIVTDGTMLIVTANNNLIGFN